MKRLYNGELHTVPFVRTMNNHFILFDLKLPPLAVSIIFCFSNQQGAMFFFFKLFSFPSFILQWYLEEGTLFLEYVQSNHLLYIGRCFEFYLPSYTDNKFFICYSLWPLYLRHSPPAQHFEALNRFPLQFS